MLDAYRRVLTKPGAAAFCGTGLVARIPASTMTLGIVLLVSATTGSYALAGQLSATFIIGNAAFAVPHGRLADVFGQLRVLGVDAVLFGLTSSVMVVAVLEGWSAPWPYVLALLAGMSQPQAGALVRSRWAHLLTDAREKHTAFAVEGVVDEIVFVTGPALVTLLATTVAPQAGLVVAITAGSLGAAALAAQRRTQPPVHPREHGVGRPAMPWVLMLPLGVGAVALGALFGGLEVATVALARDEGRPAFAGLMLAAFSLGSLVAGVWAGAVVFRRSPLTRARLGISALACGTLVLPLLPGLGLVTLALVVTGLALAPTLIALFSLVQATVPPARLNEAMGIIQTGVSAGIAPGAWGAGVVADAHGGASAYWVCAVAAVLAACSGVLVRVPSEQ